MNKFRYTILFILAVITLAPLEADAGSLSDMKKQAEDKSSEVYDSFMAAFPEVKPDERIFSLSEDYSKLLGKYQSETLRDTIDGINGIYPTIDKEAVKEFRSLDESGIRDLLSKGTSDEVIINLAVARSKRIYEAENSWDASLNLYPQTVYLQDLVTTIDSFSGLTKNGTGADNNREMIQMNYPSPRMLSLRGAVVDLDVEIGWLEFLKKSRDVIADTKSLLAEIRNSDEMIEINKESASLLRMLKDITEVQYKAGTRGFADLVRIKTELEKRLDTINRMESMLTGQFAQLASALNLPPDTRFGKITWTSEKASELSEERLIDEVDESRQELAQIARQVRKMDAMLEMSKIMAVPDLTLGFSYYQGVESEGLKPAEMQSMDSSSTDMASMDNSDSMDGMDEMSDSGSSESKASMDNVESSVMQKMTFMNSPMVDYRSNLAADLAWVNELVDRRDAMVEMSASMHDMSRGMITMLVENIESMSQSEKTYSGKVIPEAEAALKVVRVGYSSNENDFNDLIGSELTLLMARMELVNVSLERRHAVFELERLIGKELANSQQF